MKRLVGCALLALLFLCGIAPVARADTSAPSQQPGNYIQVAMFGSAFDKVPPITPQDMAEDLGSAERFMFEKIEKAKKEYTLTTISISILIVIFLLVCYFYIFNKTKRIKKSEFILKFTLILLCIFFVDTILIKDSHKEIEASITTEYRPYIQELREKQNQKIKFPVMEEIFSTQSTKPSPKKNQNNDELRNLEDRIKDFKRTIDSLLN